MGSPNQRTHQIVIRRPANPKPQQLRADPFPVEGVKTSSLSAEAAREDRKSNSMKQMRTMLMTVVFGCLCVPTCQAFYNPQTGRWLSRDPIGEEGSSDLHNFVRNSPASFTDMDGRTIFVPNPTPIPIPIIPVPIEIVDPKPRLGPDDQIPSDFTGFAICQRDIVAGDCIEECINKSGQGHKFMARIERGEVTAGKGYYRSGVETEKLLKCERGKTCKRTHKKLKYGQYRGMPADGAGDRAIWECIAAHPGWKHNYYKPPIRDCRFFPPRVATDCGLDCGQ